MRYKRTGVINTALMRVGAHGVTAAFPAGFTYMPEQDATGWHHHDTHGRFEDVAVMPGTPDGQIWFLV